jgi:hypothetical protein
MKPPPIEAIKPPPRDQPRSGTARRKWEADLLRWLAEGLHQQHTNPEYRSDTVAILFQHYELGIAERQAREGNFKLAQSRLIKLLEKHKLEWMWEYIYFKKPGKGRHLGDGTLQYEAKRVLRDSKYIRALLRKQYGSWPHDNPRPTKLAIDYRLNEKNRLDRPPATGATRAPTMKITMDNLAAAVRRLEHPSGPKRKRQR